MIIHAHAFARAGLIGNPSDGYFGKTISFIIRNFRANVHLWESPHFEIMPTFGDLGRFDRVADFLWDTKLHGYYGGMRLMKAAVKRFHDYCRQHQLELHDRNFTISYDSDIPRLVGLAGSSALVTATMRALMRFYEVEIPKTELPTLILSVEKDELDISAGLQDRVIQVYEGIVYMDFDREYMEKHGHGIYEPLDPPQPPPLYVAYDPQRAEISDVSHRNLRQLFEQGDPTVVNAMKTYRQLTDRGREALMKSDWPALGAVMDENFNLRRTFMDIAPENQRMIDTARSTGASAKFCGSGGAICGLYRDGHHYQQIVDAMATLRCTVFRPMINEH